MQLSDVRPSVHLFRCNGVGAALTQCGSARLQSRFAAAWTQTCYQCCQSEKNCFSTVYEL